MRTKALEVTNLNGFAVYKISKEDAYFINYECQCSRCEKPIEELFLVPATSKVFCKPCLSLWRKEFGCLELIDEMANIVNSRYYKRWLEEGA